MRLPGPPQRRARVGKVVDQRGLAVGPGTDDLELLAPEGASAEELGDRPRPAELQRLGRHGEPGVRGQQGHQPADVKVLERVDEAVDDRGLGGGLGQRHVADVPPGPQAGPCPDQRAVDRRRAGAEDVGGLRRGEAEHVAQHQDRSLLRRQVLQARDERQRDGLPRVIPGLRARGHVAEQHLRVGLKPPRVIRPCQARPPSGLVWPGRRAAACGTRRAGS